MALNDKQSKFLDNYLIHFNATRAALEAGYSEKTAYSIGSELLRKPEIMSRVREIIDDYGMQAAEVIYHISQIARTDITDVLDDNGNVDFEKARRYRKTGLIKSIKSRTITTETSDIVETEVVMHDKLSALGLLAKYHGLLIDRTRNEDWRTDILKLISERKITMPDLEAELGVDVAQGFATAFLVSSVDAGENE